MLLVVVMLVHYARPVPFPEDAPAQSAGHSGRPDEVDRPGGVRLDSGVCRDRGVANRDEQPPDFRHYVKRKQEAREEGTRCRLSTDRLLLAFAAYLYIVGVERVKDLKKLFVPFADLSLNDGRV